jgi:hypothetical protein
MFRVVPSSTYIDCTFLRLKGFTEIEVYRLPYANIKHVISSTFKSTGVTLDFEAAKEIFAQTHAKLKDISVKAKAIFDAHPELMVEYNWYKSIGLEDIPAKFLEKDINNSVFWFTKQDVERALEPLRTIVLLLIWRTRQLRSVMIPYDNIRMLFKYLC